MPASKRRKTSVPAPRQDSSSGRRRVADEPVAEAGSLGATVRSPRTETGLTVEEQVRKEWDAKQKGGLPTSLRRA